MRAIPLIYENSGEWKATFVAYSELKYAVFKYGYEFVRRNAVGYRADHDAYLLRSGI